MKEHKEFGTLPGLAALIPVVRALICYDYEKGKKNFKHDYNLSKLEASIGNEVIQLDLDDDSDFETFDSDEDEKVAEQKPIKKQMTLASTKIKSSKKKVNNRDSVVAHSDISIDLRTDAEGDYKSLVYLEQATRI